MKPRCLWTLFICGVMLSALIPTTTLAASPPQRRNRAGDSTRVRARLSTKRRRTTTRSPTNPALLKPPAAADEKRRSDDKSPTRKRANASPHPDASKVDPSRRTLTEMLLMPEMRTHVAAYCEEFLTKKDWKTLERQFTAYNNDYRMKRLSDNASIREGRWKFPSDQSEAFNQFVTSEVRSSTQARAPINRRGVVTFPADAKDPTEFYNANIVNASSGFPYLGKKTFIFSKEPFTPQDRRKFWRTIWEYNVQAIVSVKLAENEKAMYYYFPMNKDEPKEYDDIKVQHIRLRRGTAANTRWFGQNTWNLPESEDVHVEKVLMEVWKEGHPRRPLAFIGVPDWVDNGVPLNLFSMIEVYNDVATADNILVHCSAGVGRTGTFLTFVMAMHALQAGQKPDLLELVKQIREYRAEAVQNTRQFMYLHYAIVKHAQASGLFGRLSPAAVEKWTQFERDILCTVVLHSYRRYYKNRPDAKRPAQHKAFMDEATVRCAGVEAIGTGPGTGSGPPTVAAGAGTNKTNRAAKNGNGTAV